MSQSPKTDQRSDETDQHPKQDPAPDHFMDLLRIIAEMFPFLDKEKVMLLSAHSARISRQTYSSDVDVAKLLLEMVTKCQAAEKSLAEANKKIEELKAQVAGLQAPKTGNQKPNVPALPAKTFANIAKQQLPLSQTLVETVPQAGTWAAEAEKFEAEEAKSETGSDKSGWVQPKKTSGGPVDEIAERLLEEIDDITYYGSSQKCGKCELRHVTHKGTPCVDTKFIESGKLVTVGDANGKTFGHRLTDKIARLSKCNMFLHRFAFRCNTFKHANQAAFVWYYGDYVIIFQHCPKCLVGEQKDTIQKIISERVGGGSAQLVSMIMKCVAEAADSY